MMNQHQVISLNNMLDTHLKRLHYGEFLLQEAFISLSKTPEYYIQEVLPKYELNGLTYNQPSIKIISENFKFVVPKSLYPLVLKFTEDITEIKNKILGSIEQATHQVYRHNFDSESFIQFIKEKLVAFTDCKDVDNILYRISFFEEESNEEVSKTFRFVLPDKRILYIDVVINYEEIVLPLMKKNGFYGWYVSNTKKKDFIHTDSRKRKLFFWRITNFSTKDLILLWFSNLNNLEE